MTPAEDLIPANDFCSHYKVTFSFISSLQQFGLIEMMSVEETNYIPQSQLQRLEQLIRMHYDLNINLEGIDAITHLLDRVRNMQTEIGMLKSRLRLYESID